MAEPRVKYATTADGVGIAFADTGGDGVPVLFMRGSPFTHVQQDLKLTSYRFWFANQFARRRLITFDCRGCGLSDWDAGEVSVEAFGRDIAAVADKLGLERFVLMAVQADGFAAISFAADSPERVSHLILWDTYADGARFAEIPQTKAFLSMIENDWELFTTTLAHFINGWDTQAATEYVEFVNEACTQEQVLDFFKNYVMHADVSAGLPRVTQPTVVFSHKNVAIPDFDMVRNLASRLPNAELVVLESTFGQRGDDPPIVEAALDRLLGDAPAAVQTEPAAPAIGSPAFRPMRTFTCFPASARWIAIAQSSAPAAEPNETMKPSPIVFTSEPPCAASASRVIRSCSRKSSRARASPSSCVSAVEPSMSVKRIVTREPIVGAAGSV